MSGHKSVAGKEKPDETLFFTYVRNAWQAVCWAQNPPNPTCELPIQEGYPTLNRQVQYALQALVFTAFTLEYRLKRIINFVFEKQISKPKRPTRRRNDKEWLDESGDLGELLMRVWCVLNEWKRLDKNDRCGLSTEHHAEWLVCAKKLDDLREYRNMIGHANYNEILKELPIDEPKKCAAIARDCFDAFIDAMALINFGIGYKDIHGEPSALGDWKQRLSRLKGCG